ncbi:MAG: HAMP domain-containing histidine kinase [Clostridiales bacterium]|nr:HAMP domain-containing histidine kinase [Clostridiales bacterium]
MKKKGLSFQITLVFLVAFIITSLLLGVLITNRLDGFYKNSIYERLEAEGKALKQNQDLSDYQQAEGISYIKYVSSEKSYRTSANIDKVLDDKSIKLLINKAATQEKTSARYVNIIGDDLIYYVILNYQGFYDIQQEDIFILVTDNQMKNTMVRETTIQILIVSIISFFVGYLVILLWVFKLIKDTKKISGYLSKIGNSNYKTKIHTNRHDEIGELADSIELMRNKISKNEKQKQEIIQGVSHDLKTPIAIIQSYAEALKDGMCEAEVVADITKRECTRLNDKVTKLLYLTRLNYIDISSIKAGHTDMKKLIEDMISQYNFQTEADVLVKLDESSFFGDKESWRIVVENIIDNAIRYAKIKILITLSKDKLTIYNDGSHIDELQASSIFNAYEKSKDGKFGLGLSIVKKTIDLFGYEVKVENIDNGVVFIISK